ncbi:GGDEF domain-containing protein [Rhodoferax antarcticus]|uniref:GGDEF domain-containing protein n=1 Tax=Rhodoferax antarcticus TaxID=81479 RepID=UPI00222491AB|nr:GGDEF domain-containing protein [Rhodoferax antarcticus]MCW2310543.1 diguanylate cyclase (GGDEF)-like protein [Rhodoferax antarcticus]
MRWGLATRLGGVLALVSLLMAGMTGLYAYQVARELLVQAAKDELMTATQVVARRVSDIRQDASRDLQLLAHYPASLALLQGPPAGQAAQAEQLATLFELLMSANPAYFQMRLISASSYGLERVRVDRDGDTLLRVQGDDLQEKRHYPYVSDTLKLPAGSTYLSRIVINRERGAHAGLGQPTVQMASPVTNAQGRALGVIVVNLDLKGAFTRLAADLPAEFQLFLANQQGDFLIHPDSSKTFGFDAGRRVLMQDEFPATRALVDDQVSQVVLEANTGAHASMPMVAAFLSRKVKIANGEGKIILGLAQPRSSVLNRSHALGMTILQIAGGLALTGFALALLLARWVTRPLNIMSTAVARFTPEQPIAGLPVHRQDELGQLARSFDHMQLQIRQQFTELQANRVELEHLARHDVLTGLPNRRLFMERLENALQRAKRTQSALAVMFIDMDHFKKINDNWGHDAGDAALQWVAQQLQANTRKTDTVARLGGDEFVVLLESPVQREQIDSVAQKLLDAMREPWFYDGHLCSIGLSMGISVYPENGDTADALLSSADSAMYSIKSASRNNFGFAPEG